MASPKRGGRRDSDEPLSSQPGHSWRYLYERLSEKQFQQLCGALLRDKDDNVRLYPVGMSDGGRDVTSRSASPSMGGVIYQVKWTKNRIQDPVAWLTKAVENEAKSIERLAAEGASKYVLMTCVAGTSIPKRGSMDRLDEEFARLSERFGIEMTPMWAADIDAMVDTAGDAIKWSYSEMLAGQDIVRFLIHGSAAEGRAAQARDMLMRVIQSQGVEDARVKFSQADLDQTPLADVYVDVEIEQVSLPQSVDIDSLRTGRQPERAGGLAYLLANSLPYTVVRGEPGQGKSTLGQYLCQVHRSAILPDGEVTDVSAGGWTPPEPKLPLRVDLRHYASWLQGNDPFEEESDGQKRGRKPRGASRGLEHFLAHCCAYYSGGREVTVEDVQDLLDRYPVLLVLDGLDEVGEPAVRTDVVHEIDRLLPRLGAVRRLQTQVIVTTRPNSSGQAEPSARFFEYVRLCPMSPALQKEYLRKWATVNGLSVQRRRALTRVFLGRTAEDHIAQLSANPMHLTILLYLINKRGDAVPTARTPIYSAYMDALMDREVERDQIVKEDVSLVHETTSWLGWRMQSGVETDGSLGKLGLSKIRSELFNYLQAVEGPECRLDFLFQASADRFWALTSKESETYEFAVQPVREYFAARYLAKYAGMLSAKVVLKGDLLAHLVQRPFWLNTTLFYAGFADPNEVSGLYIGLEQALREHRHPLQVRVALWALVRDGIFAPVTPVQRKVVNLLTDDLSLVLVAPETRPEQFPSLPDTLASDDLASALRALIAKELTTMLERAVAAARLLGQIKPQDEELKRWFGDSLADVGRDKQVALVRVGAAHGHLGIGKAGVERLCAADAEARRAAMAMGVQPTPDSALDHALLQSVTAGEASDVPTNSPSLAGSLLRAARPHRFIDLAKADGHPRFIVPTAHLEDRVRDDMARQQVFKRLIDKERRYTSVKRSSAFRAGEKGSTAPWQNTAATWLTSTERAGLPPKLPCWEWRT